MAFRNPTISSSLTILAGFATSSELAVVDAGAGDLSSGAPVKNDLTDGVLLLVVMVLKGTRGGGAIAFGSSQYEVDNGSIDFNL
jgi:hypothetical protein